MRIVRFVLSMVLVLGLIPLQGCEENGSAGLSFSPSDSLHALYSDQDVVFDPALLGEWQMEDESVFTFEASGANAYLIKAEGDQAMYEAHLVRLQGHLFLDTVPTKWQSEPASHEMHLDWVQAGVELAPQFVRVRDSIYLEVVPGSLDNTGATLKVRTRPAHWFFRIAADGHSLRLTSLNKEWLTKAMEQGSVNIDHAMVGEEPLLTAKAADLQHLVQEHYADAEAFAGDLNFHRKD
ncbi:MAG: hypothetical protein LAP21_14250 [Acidobacteriia bacterium]|nr:hypothetical protein [Terriglobia bacterium]